MYSLDNPATLPCNLYSAQQIKQGEIECAKELGISMYQLMERAGHAVFECFLTHYGKAQSILILAGGGNNGGDAYVFARLAKQSQYQITLLAAEPNKALSGDAEIARQAYLSAGGDIAPFSDLNQYSANSFNVVIDGLIGTGFRGTLRAHLVSMIEVLNNWQIATIAIDLPTGLDGEQGSTQLACLHANYTVTFIGLKLGLFTGNGPDVAGQIVYAGLGIKALFEDKYSAQAHLFGLMCRPKLTTRLKNTNKGHFGHVVCIGGNLGMSGAIYLAAKAALRSGAGKVSVFTHPENVSTVTTLCPELMVFGIQPAQESDINILAAKLQQSQSIVLGPGLGVDAWGESVADVVFNKVTDKSKPIVMDADVLNQIAKYKDQKLNIVKSLTTIMTPHPLEASRLMAVEKQQVNENRVEMAQMLANKFSTISVLKGCGTLVCDAKTVSVNLSGNPGMATAGAGDVLTGMIAALALENVNQHLELLEKVKMAVYLHGLAGDFAANCGEIGIIASDILGHIPRAIKECCQ